MILRTLTLFALILVAAAVVIAALWLASLALEAVVGWLQSLEGWQRGAIVAAGLACGLVVVMEGKE
jgi:hypothetical protein